MAYTPAWQEKFTGVGRNTVVQFAREFATTAEKTKGKCSIIVGSGVNHWYHNNLRYRALHRAGEDHAHGLLEHDRDGSGLDSACPSIPPFFTDPDRLEAEHLSADAWHREVEQLGQRWLPQNFLPPEDAAWLKDLLTSLSVLYRDHLATEEERVFPLAKAELSGPELQAMGRRMASRRGVLFIPALVDLSQ